MDEQFVQSQYSLEDLNKFRDSKGFIDITKAGIEFESIQSRELVGNPNRIKNWVNFNGTKALIKGETILEDERNYGIYAELIVEEICKQYGIETAHYDLIKKLNEDGTISYGVLSQSIVDVENGEQLRSLRDIIGDEPQRDDIDDCLGIDTTDLNFTLETLEHKLEKDGFSRENIDQVIIDYKKRLAFSIAVLDSDKHTENIAFIVKKVDGQDVISVSPNFDSEATLLLDNDYGTVEKLLEDYVSLRRATDIAQPRIATYRSEEDGGFESLWKDTLDYLCEDDEVYDYVNEVLIGSVDMDEVLENVEKRIQAKLPDDVRYMAKYAFKCRNEEMQKTLDLDLEEEEGFDINSLLKNLISQGLTSGIRTGEQIDIGGQIEQDAINRGNNEIAPNDTSIPRKETHESKDLDT